MRKEKSGRQSFGNMLSDGGRVGAIVSGTPTLLSEVSSGSACVMFVLNIVVKRYRVAILGILVASKGCILLLSKRILGKLGQSQGAR